MTTYSYFSLLSFNCLLFLEVHSFLTYFVYYQSLMILAGTMVHYLSGCGPSPPASKTCSTRKLASLSNTFLDTSMGNPHPSNYPDSQMRGMQTHVFTCVNNTNLSGWKFPFPSKLFHLQYCV